MRRHLAGTVALALALAACGVADEPDEVASSSTSAATGIPDAATATPDAVTSTPGSTPTFDVGPTPEATMGPALAAVVAAASLDVQTRTGSDADVRVVSAQEGPVRPDTLAWCADRGTVVDEASFRVVLGVEERVWLYLAGPDGEPVLCPTDERDGGTEFLPPPGIDD